MIVPVGLQIDPPPTGVPGHFQRDLHQFRDELATRAQERQHEIWTKIRYFTASQRNPSAI